MAIQDTDVVAGGSRQMARTAVNIFALIYTAGDGEGREIRLVLAKDETAGKTV